MFKKTKVCTGVLIALGGGLTLAGMSAFAQTTDRVEITGSRIKTLAVEGVSPITVIDQKEIKTDGVRNVESFLNNLPQVFADQGGNVVNGSTGTATVNLRGLGAERTLVLVNGRRMPMGSPIQGGLPPDLNQIPAGLVKRVEVLTGGASAVYGSDAVAGVVNFIMNDRFEGVLVEANYGFYNHKQQNTAGVADLVTGRAATNPAEFQVPGNKTADGKETNLSVLLGGNFAGDKGNATIFFNYKKTDALLQSERDFSACSLASPSTASGNFTCGGSGTNATGRITNTNPPALIAPVPPSTTPVPNPNPAARPNGGRVFTTADAAGTSRPFSNATDQYNFGPLNYFQRPSERYGFNAYGNYQVAPVAKVYGEFGFHDDLTVAQIAPGGAFGSVHTAAFDNPLLSASWKTSLDLLAPGDTTDFVLQRRNVEGGGRQSEYRNTSFRTLVGVKGDVGVWSYDAYALIAKVIYSQNEKNYFLNERIDRAMDIVNVGGVATCASVVNGSDPSCVPYNVWQAGGVTPQQLAYLQTPGFRKGSTGLDVFGISASADLGEYGVKLPSAKSGMGVSFGFERRGEQLALSTDPNTAAGNLSGSGGPTAALDGEYSVKELFGEFRLPLIEGAPMAEMLSVNGSYRHSNYSTDAQTNTYGLGMEWAPTKTVRLRGAYQQAVRAPNLQELYLAQGNNLYDNDEDPCAGATPTATLAQCANTGVSATQYGTIQDSPAGQYNFLQGGNPNLKPETSKSTTFGIVLTPMRDMSVSFDFFDIRVEDTISNIDPTTTLSKCLDTGNATYCSLINRDSLGTLWLLPEATIVGTNLNLGSYRTKGLDVGFSYGMGMGNMGSLGVSLVGTYLKTLEIEEVKGDGSYNCAGLYGANKCGTPNPKWRHKLRGTWTMPWDVEAALTWRYIDAVELQNTSSNPLLSGNVRDKERELAAQNYIDIAGSWNAWKGLTLSMGINNLFDKDPPITAQLATGGGNGNTYPSVYDALGRKVFLTASYKF